MAVLKVTRFTRRLFLRQIGRPLLEEFLHRFEADLEPRRADLPPPLADDDEFFTMLAALVLSPEGLPDSMNDALHAINALATPEGQQALEAGLAEAGIALPDAPASRADFAMRVWLNAPAVLARKYNQQRLLRLSTFYHYAAPGSTPRPELFSTPDAQVLQQIEEHCDRWFAAHNRGRHNTRIEAYGLAGECWFLVRHGDTFSRAASVERGRTGVLHFRPAKDDVVVYSPRQAELRINARTLGERDLYRTAFGLRLFDNPGHFSERSTYTLTPLRELGIDSLLVSGLAGLRGIVLREYELALPSELGEIVVRRAADIFAARMGPDAIPQSGELVRASFDVYFTDSAAPRKVQVRPPNTLRLARHTDAALVEPWLRRAGFRVCRAAIV